MLLAVPWQMLGEVCGSQEQKLSSFGLCRHPLLMELVGHPPGPPALACGPCPLSMVAFSGPARDSLGQFIRQQSERPQAWVHPQLTMLRAVGETSALDFYLESVNCHCDRV